MVIGVGAAGGGGRDGYLDQVVVAGDGFERCVPGLRHCEVEYASVAVRKTSMRMRKEVKECG